MNDIPFWLAALLAGFFGSTHCVGMCGGIAGVLTHAVRNQQSSPFFLLQCGFHLGRVTSYALLAIVMGGLVQTFSSVVQLQWWADFLRALAAGMLILMGLYLTRWWNGLTALERMGASIWQYIQPTFLRRSSAMKQSFLSALLSGALWGFLPCGLVYSALMTASLQVSVLNSAIFMLLFGLGTIPALLLSGVMLHNAAQLQQVRIAGGIVLMVFGAFVLWQVLPSLMGSVNDIHQHDHHLQLP